jgi:hypothetical protein
MTMSTSEEANYVAKRRTWDGRRTKVNATKLFSCGFEEVDVFIPFRDVSLDEDGIAFPELGDDGFALRGVHVDNREFPSLLCEILCEGEPNALTRTPRQREFARGEEQEGVGGVGGAPDAPPVMIPTLSGISSSSESNSRAADIFGGRDSESGSSRDSLLRH